MAIAYFIRWTLTKTYSYQSQAENAAEAVSTIFNNLPDAVLLLSKYDSDSVQSPNTVHLHDQVKYLADGDIIKVGEVGACHFDLHYCNIQADNLFKVNLSQATPKDLKQG